MQESLEPLLSLTQYVVLNVSCHPGWPGEKETFGVAQATSRVQRPDSSPSPEGSEWHILDNADYFVYRHQGQA